MRYRIKEYSVLKHPVASLYNFVFALPAEVLNQLEKEEGSNILTEASKRYIIESVRLIADETQGGYVLMSSGQKGVVNNITESDGSVGIIINKDALIAAADGDEGDIAAINAMQDTDQFTIEMDWGEEPDMTEKAIEKATEHIMGGAVPHNSGESIPAILWDAEYNDINAEGELMIYSLINPPVIMDVGSIVRADDMTNEEEDLFCVAKAVNNPSIGYDGQDYSITGATWMAVERGKSYICTAVVSLTCTHDDEEHSGKLYVYAEYDSGVSNKELRDLIAENIGNLVMATAAERTAALANLTSRLNAVGTSQSQS